MKNFWDKFKNWIIGLFIAGTAIAAPFVLVDIDSNLTFEEKIMKEKSKELKATGKYSFVAPIIDDDTKIVYRVDVYVAPPYTKEDAGYQIVMTRPDGSKKSFGVGVEANLRSYDWTIVVASSTKE